MAENLNFTHRCSTRRRELCGSSPFLRIEYLVDVVCCWASNSGLRRPCERGGMKRYRFYTIFPTLPSTHCGMS